MGRRASTHPSRHGLPTEKLQQVMDEQPPGHQHLTRWVLELLSRNSGQELAKCYG